MKLLFKGSRDGHSAEAFHSKCDNQGPTLTIIKAKRGKKFGGFLDKSWNSSGEYIPSSKAFLFSLSQQTKYDLVNPDIDYKYAATGHAKCGPVFGAGCDCYITNDWTSELNGAAPLTYHFQRKTDLAGASPFQVEDIEVYGFEN